MSLRNERVRKALMREISDILRTEIKDPKIAGIVSITDVDVSPDNSAARVFYSVFGDEKTKELQEEYLCNINYDMSYHRLKKELVETFSLNRQEALEKFVAQGIYKLLSPDCKSVEIHTNIESLIKENPVNTVWIVYMGLFNLENLELTRAEKKIIEWAERLKHGDSQNNNTPLESILINKIRG